MKNVYLDYNATTPVDKRVLEAMLPFFSEKFGNASSLHRYGVTANKHIEIARKRVARLLNAFPEEITFTSSATESINTILRGIAWKFPEKKHLISVATEHSAVLETLKFLEEFHGCEVSILPVSPTGRLDLSLLERSIREDTLLVSVMHVNNETGIIHPVEKIAKIVHAKGSFLFCDATQSVGKIPVDVRKLKTDFLCFSGHKFYAPKGIGGMFIRKNLSIVPLLHGGNQEKFRSSTLNTPHIVGLGTASLLALREMDNDAVRIRLLRDWLENKLSGLPGAFLNGNTQKRIYNVINIGFRGWQGKDLQARLPEFAISTGSACGKHKVSHVLLAMGRSPEEARSSLRISLGKYTLKEEVEAFYYAMKRILTK